MGSYGATDIATPHLDQLAANGARFTSYYATQPVCSASRASILTGCYPDRIGIHNALGPGAKVGLHPDEETLAELLKQKGYATGIFGKWHLGDARNEPLKHGFDEYRHSIPMNNKHPNRGRFQFPDINL